MYVQDNAPPLTARDTAAFVDRQDVEVMDRPAGSPDMRSYVSQDPRRGRPPFLRQAWARRRPGRVQTLVDSMSRRVRALLAAKGGHTRY